ncbi:MAG: phosphatidylserine decarboxylase [Phycisphaerae bacterium]|nr:phosphatidylserine decarboxylase [Phycisphaerae bacterium]
MPAWCLILMEVLIGLVLIWALSFFRDPHRACPQDSALLLSPADGKVTDTDVLEDHPDFDGKVLRIGIFLSIFNVHLNRMPCGARVEKILYKPGAFKNALNPESSRVNESNAVFFTRTQAPEARLMVRQISGAIARHIVCPVQAGQVFSQGDKFGMIKFGSRTELFVPVQDGLACCVKVGDGVKAGLTIVARYQ